MDIDHSTAVSFAKTFGLFYFIAMSVLVVVYAFWPSKQAQFDRAAKDILDDGEAPWQ